MELKKIGFIGVHLGAGNHSKSRLPEYKKVSKMACRKAMEAIRQKKTALEAVSIAIKILEDCPLSNAGIGSNLTLSGTVECDASIMDGLSSNFGAVAAVRGIQNPIMVAKKLIDEQSNTLPSGRVAPMLLCGVGAYHWAAHHNIPTIPDNSLISENALDSFRKYSKIDRQNRESSFGENDNVDQEKPRKRPKMDIYPNKDNKMLPNASSITTSEVPLETVGAVCLDNHGNLCSGVSSGGLLLKYPGRIGQAAVYGAGCWSSNSTKDNPVGMACSSSGCGEQLIKTLLCKECSELSSADRDGVTTLQELLQNKFLGSFRLEKTKQKLGGMILLQCRNDGLSEGSVEKNVEFTWGHTTQTMAVGYMSISDSKPQLTTLEQKCSPGGSVLVQGVTKHL